MNSICPYPVSIQTSFVVVVFEGMAKLPKHVYHIINNANDSQAKATANDMLISREERQNTEPMLLIHLHTNIFFRVRTECKKVYSV